MDPGMLPVLNKMLDWYLVNRPIEAEANRYADLERSSIIAKRMADIVELDKGLAHADTVAINRKMAQIHWFTVKYLVERGISVEPGIVIATGSPAQNPNTRNVSVKSHIAAGREAFSKIAEAVGQDENRSPVEYAEALAQLGDWNLAFGKKQTAGNSYKEAWAVLNEGQDSTDFADAYFAQPVPVRFMQDELVTLLDEQPDQNEVYVDVSLTVTEGGRPLDVEFINPPEFFKGDYVRRVKRDLSNMRFRPRLENGEPAKTQDFAWQLPLTDTGNQP
jgi:hypothetical protein